MGYFKRPVRRCVARAVRNAFLEPTREMPPGKWHRCEKAMRPAAETFLRFVIKLPDAGWIGLFQSSDILEGVEDLSSDARADLARVYRWFDANLAVPRRLPKRAVCWFRADAEECLEHIRELIEIFRLAGYQVWMRTTKAPGRVVYRDQHQVAAVPYSDRRTSASAV